jgi:hypothetical protein
MNALLEVLDGADEMGGRNTATLDLEEWMDPSEEELQTLEALLDQAAEQDRVETEIPWSESNDNERHAHGAALSIEQEPCGKDTELVVIGIEANQGGFANFWDIGPEPPPRAETADTRSGEPGEHGEAFSKTQAKMERFSSLTDTLRKIEARHIDAGPLGKEAIAQSRLAVVQAINEFSLTRFNLGKALAAYRVHFKANRGWMAAAASIAATIGCDERTVRNIITDYERVASLPETVIHAAQTKGFDLSQRKYRPAVAAIESTIGEDGDGRDVIDADDADRIVSNILVMPAPDKREQVHDDPFVPLTREEKQRFSVRMKIRTALTNIEPDQRLSALIAALEEEMFAVWSQSDPVTVTIRPHPSELTLDGRKRREEVA